MPTPGDVDVVIGAELMEAGRAILRGLVTPDRTTLIASTHRSFAVQEKLVPGDGIGDSSKVVSRPPGRAAKRFIAFDMAALADKHRQRHLGRAVRRARRQRRAAVRARGLSKRRSAPPATASSRACAPSRRALSARRRMPHRRHRPTPPKPASAGKLYPALAPVGDAAFDALVADARTTFPATLHGMIAAGMRKVVDFQDVGSTPANISICVAGFLRLERGGESRA